MPKYGDRQSFLPAPQNDNTAEKEANSHENEIRWRNPVHSEDEREKMKSEPKVFSNIAIEKTKELTVEAEK